MAYDDDLPTPGAREVHEQAPRRGALARAVTRPAPGLERPAAAVHQEQGEDPDDWAGYQAEDVDLGTGEVVPRGRDVTALTVTAPRAPLPTFASGSMLEIVRNLTSPEALEAATALSNAYDRACRALLSDADIQKEGGKEFKKKSAWRKLGRTFGISTEIIHVDGRWSMVWDEFAEEPVRHFTASAMVRATAPWGMVMEELGLCTTRESRFYTSGAACPICGGPMFDNRGDNRGAEDFKCKAYRSGCTGVLMPGEYDEAVVEGKVPNKTARGKAEHDCTSTAVTRATNRAISNLIAAGEVSAEEVEGGDERSFHGGGAPTPAPRQQNRGAAPRQEAPKLATEAQRAHLGEYLDHPWVPESEKEYIRGRLADGKLTFEDAGKGLTYCAGNARKWRAEYDQRRQDAAPAEDADADDIGAKEARALAAEAAAAADDDAGLFEDPRKGGRPAQAEGR